MMTRIRGLTVPVALVATLAACGDILDVNNPNNLLEPELENATSARSIVNGASGLVAKGIGAMLGPYAVATDEAIWIGSRDAWRELDAGNLADPRNEFTDDAFRYFAQGRWMADDAVERLEEFDAEGTLSDRTLLARAYLYAAVQYITIGDMFEDFVITSDKREPGQPVGPANMGTMYDQAITYLDLAAEITAGGTSDAARALHFAVLATRARAKQSQAIRAKVDAVDDAMDPEDPLVSVPGAVADAQAALAIAPSEDARVAFTLATDDLAYAGEASIAYNVNQRRELQLGPTFVLLSSNRRTIEGTALEDPIDDIPAPAAASEIGRFTAAFVNQSITYASVRELYLILAEAALAEGDMAGFTAAINDLRELDDLTPYSGQVPAVDLLIHSRAANLFMQGRRLSDLYRFDLRSAEWQDNSTAVQDPGTLLPITCIELRANPNLSGTC